MPLIRTKLLPATSTKGTRIKAYYQDQTVTIGYSYTGNPELESNHRRAVIAMLNKLGIDWIDLDIITEELNDFEFIHVWKEGEEHDIPVELSRLIAKVRLVDSCAADWILKNKDNKEYDINPTSSHLNSNFLWHKTPQGVKYWSNIEVKINELDSLPEYLKPQA